MAENTTQPTLIADSESLLSGCAQNADFFPGIEPLVEGLEGALVNFKSVKATQENFEGHRQATTQRLNEAAELVREAARRVRGFIKAHLGTKSEHLPAFGIAPIRPRKNKTPSPKPPAPEAPKTAAQPKPTAEGPKPTQAATPATDSTT
jgi:hypothetical protein